MTALVPLPAEGDPYARPGNHPKENTVTERRWQDIATNPTPPAVRVGQIWESTDKRENRRVRVVMTDGAFATVARCDRHGQVHPGSRRSRIRVVGDRLGRYRLVEDTRQSTT